jgi:UDP-2-acetamido-3-amino-2,3-dideoxy-glucuronate N-acetyltransferase
MNGIVNEISVFAKVAQTSKVWHFSVILAEVTIGESCNIGSHVEIGRGTRIGNGCRIGKGVFLPPHSVIGNNVFIGPMACFCDDKWPRVNNADYDAQPPTIEDGASIGAGATILPGVRIGAGALVGAGAIVTKDVPPGAVVRCEPARERVGRTRDGEDTEGRLR